MRKTLQTWIGIIFLLFLLPIIADQIPNGNSTTDDSVNAEKVVNKKDEKLVYAANLTQLELPAVQEVEEPLQALQGLLYFTHPYEAFEPITAKLDGKVAVARHPTKNIMELKDQIKAHFELSGIQMDVLDVDNEKVMSANNQKYPRAYDSIRPYVQEKIAEKQYDIILDLHRDVLPAKSSTITYNGEKFAKVMFVIGQENQNFRLNEALAKKVSDEIEKLVPGISRGLMHKMGHGVDGVYNQDLSKNLLVVELGGYKNSEEEINRSIAILSKAISNALQKPESVDTASIAK